MKINLGKFLDCLVRYKRDCELTVWKKRELSKFYFANLLARRVQISLQSAEMIFEVCKKIQEKNFYYQKSRTKIRGIQFLQNTGEEKFTENISLNDINLLKFIAKYENLMEHDYERRKIGFQAFTGWAGTLMPEKFVPVTSGHFRHSIAYLFDIKSSAFAENDYNFFAHSQKFFKKTKEKLKNFDLDGIYLDETNEYIKFNFPKAAPKKKYSEYDWNWITQDFHTYIFREILCLDDVDRISVQQRKKQVPISERMNDGRLMNIYVP